MLKLLILTSIFTLAICGIIEHAHLGDDGHHERATSYQNIHIEHFHAVPTYIKKEHKQLLEHPISLGKSSSKVEIHHGDKHDHGYATASVHNDVHGHGHGGDDYSTFTGHEGGLGLEHGAYQVEDHGELLQQHSGLEHSGGLSSFHIDGGENGYIHAGQSYGNTDDYGEHSR